MSHFLIFDFFSCLMFLSSFSTHGVIFKTTKVSVSWLIYWQTLSHLTAYLRYYKKICYSRCACTAPRSLELHQLALGTKPNTNNNGIIWHLSRLLLCKPISTWSWLYLLILSIISSISSSKILEYRYNGCYQWVAHYWKIMSYWCCYYGMVELWATSWLFVWLMICGEDASI
jgi:hypothetical protein